MMELTYERLKALVEIGFYGARAGHDLTYCLVKADDMHRLNKE